MPFLKPEIMFLPVESEIIAFDKIKGKVPPFLFNCKPNEAIVPFVLLKFFNDVENDMMLSVLPT